MAVRRLNRVRPVAAAYAKALRSVAMRPEDVALVELAQQYADAIDADRTKLASLGPRLLAALVELRMTPRARAAVGRGADDGNGRGSELDALRAKRERRAAVVDAAT